MQWSTEIESAATTAVEAVRSGALYYKVVNKWKALDTDNDGSVSWTEFKVGMTEEMGEEQWIKVLLYTCILYTSIYHLIASRKQSRSFALFAGQRSSSY